MLDIVITVIMSDVIESFIDFDECSEILNGKGLKRLSFDPIGKQGWHI